MKIDKDTQHNPIVHDVSEQHTPRSLRERSIDFESFQLSLRHYRKPVEWNYGCIPQTLEDPTQEGDGYPIDVLEIGSQPLCIGAITEVLCLQVGQTD